MKKTPGGDEQVGGKKVYFDPSYTAKSGKQVEAERDARPYKYELKGEVKK